MKKLIIFLASAALLTGYAQTSNQSGNSGNSSNSSSSNRSRFNSTVSTRSQSGSSGSNTTTRTTTTSRSRQSSSTSQNTTAGSTNQLTFDQVFLRRATAESLEEVVLGGIAQTNSQNTDVQNFGALLVTNHTASIAQAQQLATQLGVTLPTTLNTNQQRQVQRLSALTGDAFDRAFISLMIQNHIQDIRSFEIGAILAKNADVRAYARDQLPILMNHLVTALDIREGFLTTQTAGATSNATSGGTGGSGSANASAADP